MNIGRWVITLVILLLGAAGIFGYKESLNTARAQQGQGMPEPSATVLAELVQTVSYQASTKVSGEVQAYKQLELNNELAGKISKLNLVSGSRVEAGDLLLELDHSEESARVIGVKARLELNRHTYKRYLRLQKNNEISDELVDQARADVEIAQSELAVLQANIRKKQISAPFTAHVGIHNLEVGQYLDSNTTITKLIGVYDYTWVDFSLPQTYGELVLGTQVEISTIADNSQVFQAEIVAVDPQLSSSSRQLKYRAQFAKARGFLKPNTLVTVAAPVAKARELVAVSDLAITRDHLGEYVFVLEDEGNNSYRAKRQKVVLGDRRGDQVMVTDGLAPDTLIATKGAFKLRPGLKVFITDENAETNAADTAS
ncbi:efflux RND transporter periplasmic adaptor subunit [Thalassomonas actiniarum]|uniref:Efflux RND transporter periplasmic adaptor subunit n=1 Tax=Thalassomonas actiniarum TaxID=485447 RepID=A0AAE9YRF5_9GAMM|nr:efflux RND transporter periplasmic adaptor subunit [Thalassomonas actiniarum]WDD99043.1 efflux RND transporter periplasmic adaptor subunit [Thalassomonas actiniarum]